MVIHIITRVNEVSVLMTYNWVDPNSEKTVDSGFAPADTSWLFMMSVWGVFSLSLMPGGTGIEEGEYNVHPKTVLATASCTLLEPYYLSPYSSDLEPRNFHRYTSLMNHFEVKHFWHRDEMKAEVNQVCVKTFLSAHFQHFFFIYLTKLSDQKTWYIALYELMWW